VVLVALAVVAMVGGTLGMVIARAGPAEMGPLRRGHALAATQQVRSPRLSSRPPVPRAPATRIILREVLPNVMPHLIVVATVEAASAILLEAALSFLGLGVQPPLPSWGLMISEAKASCSSPSG
jgi:peptide/nickel transport system permease protein